MFNLHNAHACVVYFFIVIRMSKYTNDSQIYRDLSLITLLLSYCVDSLWDYNVCSVSCFSLQ